MSKLANLKKKAADLEHKRLFDRALAVYEEVLQEQEGAEEADIGLFNRVGDLHLRQGNVEAALKRYEQAVELYTERGFHNNAVALCNKILRQDPSRAEIHFRLGQISCSKGFRTEARRHFQEYVAQLNRAGSLERAVTAIRTFADENGELDAVRQMLADILLTHGRVADAVAQLRLLWEQYEGQQRHGDAQAVLARILELDPDFRVDRGASAAASIDGEAGGAAGTSPSVRPLPSPRTYAAPDLVLFDPSDFSTPLTTSPTPSTSAMDTVDVELDLESAAGQDAAEHFAELLGDAPEADGAAMPDGLILGADFGEVETASAMELGSFGLTPLDLEPTTLEIESPDLLPTALEGLEDRPGEEPVGDETASDDPTAPMLLADAWDSAGGAWEIPTLADELPSPALDLALPDEEALASHEPAPDTLELFLPYAGDIDESPLSPDSIRGGEEDDDTDDIADSFVILTDESQAVEDIGSPVEGAHEALELPMVPIDGSDAGSGGSLLDGAFTLPDLPAAAQSIPADSPAPSGEGEPTASDPHGEPVNPDAAPAEGTAVDEPAQVEASVPVEAPVVAATADDRPDVAPAAGKGAAAEDSSFVNLGDWLREDDEPRSTRMVTEEHTPSGDEQADFAEMLRKFKQGVADNVDEDDHDSHYDLGIAFREMGLVDEAVAAFQRALRGTSQRVRAFEALGQCFIDKEQFAVATSVLQRALQEPGASDERLVGVLYLLGRSAEAQNQRTEALRYYQRVFAVDIEFGDVIDRIGAVQRVPL